ncbi:hypothetical protein RYX36_031236 [Vicia faba]
MFGTTIRDEAKRLKPKLGAVTLTMPPEQRRSITKALFDIIKQHSPIIISNTWECVQEVGLKDLTNKSYECSFEMDERATKASSCLQPCRCSRAIPLYYLV